jgi:hypothetical protein
MGRRVRIALEALSGAVEAVYAGVSRYRFDTFMEGRANAGGMAEVAATAANAYRKFFRFII